MRIGVLGGGQLGRMLGLAGIPLGLEFRFFDASTDAPALAAGELVCGNYDDQYAMHTFASGLDVVTYEFENVPVSALDIFGDKLPIRPGRRALEVSQDRVIEKTFFAEAGVAAGEWRQVNSSDELCAAVADMGECIVKTRRMGYDGEGQARVKTPEQCNQAWSLANHSGLIVEKLVPFQRELSLVGVRAVNGDLRFWPLVQNVHLNGILHKTTAPAPEVSAALQQQAEAMVASIMTTLDYVGVLTVEFFDLGGELLANEMAPRVHNSGHWTIEGSVTSQFENHVRAIAGLPLGSTNTRFNSVMINCIGDMPRAADVLEVPCLHLHDYGKSAREGRKVGRVTICNEPTNHQDFAANAAKVEKLVDEARLLAADA